MGQQCSPCEEDGQITKADRGFKYYDFIENNIVHSKFIQSENRKQYVQIVASKGFYHFYDNKALLFSEKFGYYEGDVNENNEAHGKGTLISLNWDEYKGQFKNNKYDGFGTIKNKQKSIKFEAFWKQGFPLQGILFNGKVNTTKTYLKGIEKLPAAKKYYAEVTLPSKLSYKGEFIYKQKNLIFQGRGFMQFPDGSTYNGNWVEGRMQGFGKYQWHNGNFYEGNYSSGKRNGKGKMFFKKQNMQYDGIWEQGSFKEESIICQSIDASSERSQQSLIKNQNTYA